MSYSIETVLKEVRRGDEAENREAKCWMTSCGLWLFILLISLFVLKQGRNVHEGRLYSCTLPSLFKIFVCCTFSCDCDYTQPGNTVIHLLMLLLKGFSLALKMPLCLAGYFTCCITCYYYADLKCLQWKVSQVSQFFLASSSQNKSRRGKKLNFSKVCYFKRAFF